jgi:hypothetical protein
MARVIWYATSVPYLSSQPPMLRLAVSYKLTASYLQLVLVWTPGKGSPIHDHANAHCLMKVLRGTLRETRFSYPDAPNSGLKVIKETTYKENEVTYMSDELGLHKISNQDEKQLAVSLHCECHFALTRFAALMTAHLISITSTT